MKPTGDRRAHRRVPVEIAVQQDEERNFLLTLPLGPRLNVLLEIDSDSDHNFYAGLSNDISEGGVFVATDHLLPIGASVVLSIQIPTSRDAYRIEGIVRWSRDADVCRGGAVPGYGVQFLALPDEALLAIRCYVAQHETLLFEAA